MRNITLILFIVFLIPILWWFIESIWYEANGYYYAIPGPALTKWYDIFLFKLMWYTMFLGIPAIADIVLLVISIVKIKKEYKKEE
ncbi:MAG: hypothetical protein E7310_02240 [Clostridiales bacterium]|nr:hypothetical protein [Clostridiales bacterium]